MQHMAHIMRSRAAARTLAIVLFGLSALQPARAADCVVMCASPTCGVQDGGKAAVALARGQRDHVLNCPDATMQTADAILFGIYQSKQGPKQFKVIVAAKPFKAMVPGLVAEATCGIGDDCVEERERSRVTQLGGMGADDIKVVHEGRPCAMGLPCGTVLRPAQSLSFDVPTAMSGRFILTGQRGAQKSSATYDFSGGHIDIPASALTAGGVYRYELQGAGVPTTKGEFSVVSQRMQNDIEKSIEDLARQDPASAALGEIEILMAEELTWDATQRMRR